MKGRKWVASLVTVLLILACLGGCRFHVETSKPTVLPTVGTPSPMLSATAPKASLASTTAEDVTPNLPTIISETLRPEADNSPLIYEYSKYAALGFTNDHYINIGHLICNAHQISDFSSIKDLSESDYLEFASSMFNDLYADPDSAQDNDGNFIVSKSDVDSIISSAFGIKHVTKKSGSKDLSIYYRNGIYTIADYRAMGSYWPYLYQINKLSSNKWEFYVDIILYGGDGVYYNGSERVVIQQDDNKRFGFKLISCQRGKNEPSKFDSVTASSYSSLDDGEVGYPAYALDDNKFSSAWTVMGSGQWLMLSSETEQPVTGILNAVYVDNSELLLKIEMSDGSVFVFKNDVCNLSFGETKLVKWIKLSFANVDENDSIYVYDFNPY